MPGRVAAYAHPGHLLVTRTDGSLVAVPFDVKSRRITGDPVPLLSGLGSRDLFTWTGYTAVANTGALVYVGGQEIAVDLVWVGPAGAVVEVDSAVTGVNGEVRVSRDGRFVAIESIKDNVGGIDVRDRISGATSRVQVTGGGAEEPSFSADSRSLVFRVVSPGSTGIYLAELGRLSQRRVLVAEERVGRATLSADGRTLYFARGTERGAVLVARPIDGTVSDERVVATPTPTRPLISPDGRWIAYVSSESGTRQVYVQSADTSRTERWIVSRAARGALAQGVNVRWSPDGRQLYFIAGEQLVAAQVSGGETFSVGRLTTLFPVSQYLPSFEVFGSGFLFFRHTAGVVGAPLMMVQDWRALLRSR
jgi:serine/threonine-protein kinase